ncbi:hypothetical protein GUITHDRAFT_148167 [Guillardia theta CCMP2712]|uniref:Uncharacterized protein n=1 Tax=Guillardia theta (strain CCMP2712) TaxID=905079 RepID=L1IAH0_GUITC|nr:hypothetical protein GUITHDRAFT_148167 [Guillardia theta CCMP2712]EKX33107.1 hypothetical protein GUITHDRAFT_148167 [Guillardia theta CCMP2712]|eukprot:XP_005820087.1 hypothetical protein GUITHDRAFT_148167 [Guillardia theta CCMP2712]
MILSASCLVLLSVMLLLLLSRCSEIRVLETKEKELEKHFNFVDNLCSQVNEQDLQAMKLLVDDLCKQTTTDAIQCAIARLESCCSSEGSHNLRRCYSTPWPKEQFLSSNCRVQTNACSALQQTDMHTRSINGELRCNSSPTFCESPRSYEGPGCSPISLLDPTNTRDYRHSDVGCGYYAYEMESKSGCGRVSIKRSNSFSDGTQRMRGPSGRRGSKFSSGSKFYARIIANRAAFDHKCNSFYL